MGNNIDWGQGVNNNEIGWGQGAAKNNIGFGSIYSKSWASATDILGIIIKSIFDFIARVTFDLGVYQNENCQNEILEELNDNGLLEKASLLVTPNAYKTSKLYSIIPNTSAGDYLVVRNTNATFVNSLGFIQTALPNIPRLDFYNATCPAILVEQQSTNLLTYSQDFNSGGVWNKTNTTVTVNTVTSPSGAVDGSTLTGSVTLGEHRVFQNITTSNAISISIFAKKGTQNFLQIRTQNILSGFVNFDLNLGLAAATIATAKIENYGNGWYRCTANFPAFLITNISFNLVTSLTASRGEFNALATSLSIFGAQLENGTFNTSYIKTEATSVTRNADVITVNPPVGTVKITTTFEDNTTQVVTTIPATFTMPNGRINNILMQNI
jgi:hypothetical protein